MNTHTYTQVCSKDKIKYLVGFFKDEGVLSDFNLYLVLCGCVRVCIGVLAYGGPKLGSFSSLVAPHFHY